MAQRGGKRPGAGRKKGLASVMAEKARDILVSELMKEWKPIVVEAVKAAKKGDATARAWLTDRGFGKALEQLAISDPDNVLKGVVVNRPMKTKNVKERAN